MALSRVQATPSPYTGSGTAPTRTFTTPPIMGNAIVVAVMSLTRMTTGVIDNKGNAYTLALSQSNASASHLAVYYCPAVSVTGASFTVTATFSASTFYFLVALEVGGGTPSLTVDQSASAAGGASGTAPVSGTTAALTGADDFLLALCGTHTAQSAITVQSVSPSWTQEAENLTGTTAVAGEIDSRILTGAAGTTQSCSWTTTATTTYVTAIIAFQSATAAAVATAQPYVWGPL